MSVLQDLDACVTENAQTRSFDACCTPARLTSVKVTADCASARTRILPLCDLWIGRGAIPPARLRRTKRPRRATRLRVEAAHETRGFAIAESIRDLRDRQGALGQQPARAFHAHLQRQIAEA